ncbi:MAG: flagellar biosynthetic protein FliO [Gammaproteobacteria bacterium]|nr:flagellar biosynthetic protein FliO [Gammaproteobacteria bacterium]NVK87899.1 flagellar biosynthetic protein FliO [Gammaproteobacteria bacterium]
MKNFLSTMILPVISSEVIATNSGKFTPTASSSLLSVAVALVFILLIIFACAWILRRVSGQGMGKNQLIKIKSTQMLGAKERLVVIEVDDKILLLGVTPNSINKIEQLSSQCLNVLDEQSSMSFQSAFKAQLQKTLGNKHD